MLRSPKGVILTVNQQMEKISGYSREELLGQGVDMFFSEKDMIPSSLHLSSLKNGGVLMVERTLSHKNGSTVEVEIHSKMMPDETIQSYVRDVTHSRQAHAALLKSQQSLETKKRQLEEINTALKVLIRHAEQEKREVEESVAANVLSLVEPHIHKLKLSGIDEKQANHVAIIESTLKNLVSSFVRTSVAMDLRLSPAEMQVANLIKQGMTSKEIAKYQGLSSQTVDKHRSHIRKKIGVTNKEISLRELLTSKKYVPQK